MPVHPLRIHQTMEIVATPAELAALLTRVSSSNFVALDTEFMRERTYYPKLCLIQVATHDVCALIDPLQLPDITPLMAWLAERSHLKVLHAARQDLEALSIVANRVGTALPAPIFDTQVAAGLLGLSTQSGYADLVNRRLQHSLPKAHTRTDWSQRPLSEEQLVYAADDVRYLVPLYENLRQALLDAGRLGWLEEETRMFEDPRLYRTEPAQAWLRLKGLDRLRPAQREAAKLLAAWRETLAMQHDKPRGWILPDAALWSLAERLPDQPEALTKIRELPPTTIRKRGAELLEIIQKAHVAASGSAPSAALFKPEPHQIELVKRLMNHVRLEAERLNISPELLATRRDLEQLAWSGKAEGLSSGWRRDVIGSSLVALAAGGPVSQ